MSNINSFGQSSDLPIDQHISDIVERVRNNQVTILVGETGSGKSTVVPRALAEDARRRGQEPRVLVSQPRRVAAIRLAQRVNEDWGSKHGQPNFAGYRVMNDKKDDGCAVVYATTGYLVEWLSRNENAMDSISHLILDESHERTIDMDLLSLIIKRHILAKGSNHHIRLVVMSATLDVELYNNFFTLRNVPLLPHIHVGGNRFEVEDYYLDDMVDVPKRPNLFGYEPKESTEDAAPKRFGDFWNSMNGLEDLERTMSSWITTYNKGWRDPKTRKIRDVSPSIDDSFYEFGIYLALYYCKLEGTRAWKANPEELEVLNNDDNVTGTSNSLHNGSKGGQNSSQSSESGDEQVDIDNMPDASAFNLGVMSDNLPEFIPSTRQFRDPADSTCILVFLPGEHEQLTWWEFYRDIIGVQTPACQASAAERISVHILHSTTPKEEVDKAFLVGPPGTCRIILATDIAESSVTIPDVKIVLDYGLRREMEFNTTRGSQQLTLNFISKASRIQRRGRAGRCSEGKIMAFYTRQFHDKIMLKHDLPEISQCSLETTILRVRELFARSSARDVLNTMIEPPDIAAVDGALIRLREVGAMLPPPTIITADLTDAQKEGLVTFLGRMASRLPITIIESRVLLLAAAMGAHFEGVILAAALNSPDIFSMPSSLVEHDQAKFASQLASTFGARMYTDAGSMSEPIGVLNALKLWAGEADHEARQALMHSLCVNAKRFRVFRLCVQRLAESMISIIDGQIKSKANNVFLVQSGRGIINGLRELSSIVVPEQKKVFLLPKNFTATSPYKFFATPVECLRVILVTACSPQICMGFSGNYSTAVDDANRIIERKALEAATLEAEAAAAYMAESATETADTQQPEHAAVASSSTDKRQDRAANRRKKKIEDRLEASRLARELIEPAPVGLGHDPRLIYFRQYVEDPKAARAKLPPTVYPDLVDGLMGRYERFEPLKCCVLELKNASDPALRLLGQRLRQNSKYQEAEQIRASLEWLGVSRAAYVPGKPGGFRQGGKPALVILEFFDSPRDPNDNMSLITNINATDTSTIKDPFHNRTNRQPISTVDLKYSSPIGLRFASYMCTGYPASFKIAIVEDSAPIKYDYDAQGNWVQGRVSTGLDIAAIRVPNMIRWQAKRFLGPPQEQIRGQPPLTIYPYSYSVVNSITTPYLTQGKQPVSVYCAARSTMGVGKTGNIIALTGSTVFVSDLPWHLRLVALSSQPEYIAFQTTDDGEKIVGISHEFGMDLNETTRATLPEAHLHGHYMIKDDFTTINSARQGLANTFLNGDALVTGSLRPLLLDNFERLAATIKARDPKDIARKYVNYGNLKTGLGVTNSSTSSNSSSVDVSQFGFGAFPSSFAFGVNNPSGINANAQPFQFGVNAAGSSGMMLASSSSNSQVPATATPLSDAEILFPSLVWPTWIPPPSSPPSSSSSSFTDDGEDYDGEHARYFQAPVFDDYDDYY
ncbi:hypothetical protein SmJEL517_g03126 [Synchytrium microbalum]|uniref:RNA helicase n=1 Tax=Synchytrium microbalum TaxID=1806994 RepID=A0A507C9N4_9FUNG|nr:uncharacterized protein SmJEL517_g03126 [Synchytrium microbalum]TPX34215.1 hypothetical protein SmJEL517_g03126 [Synchytrium microbalum]